MTTTNLILVSAALIMIGAGASAATPKSVKAGKITCEEFVGLDETIKPKVIYVIEGASQKGKPEEMVISVDEVSKPVAWIVEECRKTPKETVWQKVENYTKSLTKKM